MLYINRALGKLGEGVGVCTKHKVADVNVVL